MTSKLLLLPTTILAVIGWTTTRIVDRVNNTPALEYSISKNQKFKFDNIILEISNINRNIAFENVDIIFQGAGDIRTICSPQFYQKRRNFCPEIIPVQPAEDGKDAPIINQNSITFNIPKIMPGSTYRLQSGYKSDKIPIVRITSNSSVIRIIPAGIETFFQKNEILILFNSVVFWILILVISYRYKFFLNYFAKIRSYSNKI